MNIKDIKNKDIREQIEKMYEHFDVAEMTDERKAWVKDKFKTGKDFENLRIILGVIADEEAGLLINRDQDNIQQDDRYEFEDRLRKGTRDIIKNVIQSLYFLTQQDVQKEAIKEAMEVQKNADKIEEMTAEEKEKIELEKKGSGVNT